METDMEEDAGIDVSESMRLVGFGELISFDPESEHEADAAVRVYLAMERCRRSLSGTGSDRAQLDLPDQPSR